MVKKLRNEYLICYDIEDNKLRTALGKELGKYGMKRVQKSIFWGYITTAELNAIQKFLQKTLPSKDKAFITRTNFNGRGQSFYLGHKNTEFKDWEEFYAL